jgi:hypothetical protein
MGGASRSSRPPSSFFIGEQTVFSSDTIKFLYSLDLSHGNLWAGLARRTNSDAVDPTFHGRPLVERLYARERVDADPAPGVHIRDRVLALARPGKPVAVAVAESDLENAIETLGLVRVPLLRVRDLLGSEIVEVVGLALHS